MKMIAAGVFRTRALSQRTGLLRKEKRIAGAIGKFCQSHIAEYVTGSVHCLIVPPPGAAMARPASTGVEDISRPSVHGVVFVLVCRPRFFRRGANKNLGL